MVRFNGQSKSATLSRLFTKVLPLTVLSRLSTVRVAALRALAAKNRRSSRLGRRPLPKRVQR